VAGGLAEHFAVDPLIVRAIFVVLTLTGGLGVALYVAGWLLMPDPASGRAVGEDLVEKARHSPSWVPFVLIGIGILIAIGPVAHVGGPFVWGALLIGAGVWMYRRADAAPPPPPPPHPPSAGTQPPAGSRPAAEIISSEIQTAARTASTQLRSYEARAPAPRVPRPRSHLGRAGCPPWSARDRPRAGAAWRSS
jgi:phage shock protein PspC (stress-responsive transcriptional regulator)